MAEATKSIAERLGEYQRLRPSVPMPNVFEKKRKNAEFYRELDEMLRLSPPEMRMEILRKNPAPHMPEA